MKKSNVILAAIIAIVSIFLLYLWFYLGFNVVDNPLDLVISIIWWVILALAIWLIIRAEKKRQEAIRTVFVSPRETFNVEVGTRNVELSVVATLEDILRNLEYGFSKQELPNDANELYSKIVRTKTFKLEEDDDQETKTKADYKWEGQVIDVATGDTVDFASKEELEAILAA